MISSGNMRQVPGLSRPADPILTFFSGYDSLKSKPVDISREVIKEMEDIMYCKYILN